jgi:hypothetical protein
MPLPSKQQLEKYYQLGGTSTPEGREYRRSYMQQQEPDVPAVQQPVAQPSWVDTMKNKVVQYFKNIRAGK